jgi:hypothetical protein
MERSKKEWLKEQIDSLDNNEHVQLYSIISKFTDNVTKSTNGVYISCENLTEECLQEIEKYVLFCIAQHKRMDEDMKTRKTYERMMT